MAANETRGRGAWTRWRRFRNGLLPADSWLVMGTALLASSHRGRLVSTVAAARASGATVLAFKASVDELSRLATARSQDEELLQQVKKQLQQLEPEVAARLLTECQFRDEWRDEQCDRALQNLPSNCEQDPELVERMQEYVALLAPEAMTTEPEHEQQQQPWQRELLRQQRALASLLTLCPGGPERVHDVLADFMEHSRERLYEQLATVHELLMNAARSSPEKRDGEGGASPRQAWGAPTDGAAERTRASVPGGLRGLSADEFVEQLRGKHDAICCIQASVRGRKQRLSFRRLVHERLGAAVRLQCVARQGGARRAAAAERHKLWLRRCQALRERFSARRLQRAWRWARDNRRWRALWCARVAKKAKREDRAFRRKLTATLAPRPESPTGFSEFAMYTESRTLAAKREADDAAAKKGQALWRAAKVRSKHAARVAAAVVLQAAARRRLARTGPCRWRRALRAHHNRRRARLRWRTARATALALQPLQTHAVLVRLHVCKELDRVQSEAEREKGDFEGSFAKWSARMERQTLAKKLHADWIPQMNLERGESYYFNVRTGESSEEHPNMRQVRATEKKQRQLAEAQMRDRLERLRDYEEQLREGEEQQFDGYRRHAARVLSEAAANLRPTAAPRWVQR